MKNYTLQLELLSDGVFGRGDGVAGLVDIEVQHDEVGLPYLGGRTLKGLLAAECDELLYALKKGVPMQNARWQKAAERLFGCSGARLEGESIMRVGPACLPSDLHDILASDIANMRITQSEVLETLTTLRRQTMMDETGAPRRDTLRSLRVILRGTTFKARLTLVEDLSDDELALLAATVKALRRVGSGRNRGHGRVIATLLDEGGKTVTDKEFAKFRRVVLA